VTLTDGTHVAPQAWFAQARVSPTAIYHLGHDHFATDRDKDQWSIDLGLAQEDYILEQLRQLEPAARVIGEVEYATKQGAVKTVDGIIVLDDVVVLVESKSLRARLDSTSSFQAYRERLGRDLNKVFGRQLPRTAAAISSGSHPSLASIPDDRPMVALVVTPDRLHQANTAAARAALPRPPVPTALVSLGELENLVAAAIKAGGSVFLDCTTPDASGNFDVNRALRDHFKDAKPANPLLSSSFASGRWTTSDT
jgi:hypothetical protein